MRRQVLFLGVLSLIGFQVLVGVLVYTLLPSWEVRAQFGDMFGIVNTLFAGCAFLGLLYTIHLQREELALQRDELKMTREELKAAAESQEKTAISLAAQLREMQKDRETTVAIQQFEQLNSPWSVDARKLIYEIDSVASLCRDEVTLRQVERFLNYINEVSYLLAKGFIPLYPTLETFYITAVRCWSKLSLFILAERQKRGVYMNHFQWLVERSVEFWAECHPNAPIAIVNRLAGQSTTIDKEELRSQLHKLRTEASSWYVDDSVRRAS